MRHSQRVALHHGMTHWIFNDFDGPETPSGSYPCGPEVPRNARNPSDAQDRFGGGRSLSTSRQWGGQSINAQLGTVGRGWIGFLEPLEGSSEIHQKGVLTGQQTFEGVCTCVRTPAERTDQRPAVIASLTPPQCRQLAARAVQRRAARGAEGVQSAYPLPM